MIYLASPYSHDSADIRNDRHRKVLRAAAALMNHDQKVYSPIVHGHALHTHIKSALAEDHAWWMTHCNEMVDKCESMTVFCIDGWKESKGVQMEIARARMTCKPINYLWPTDDWVTPDIREVAPE